MLMVGATLLNEGLNMSAIFIESEVDANGEIVKDSKGRTNDTHTSIPLKYKG
jgi:hypothetical protein